MITENESAEINKHYAERDFSLPTKQRIEELEGALNMRDISIAAQKDCIVALEAKISRATEVLQKLLPFGYIINEQTVLGLRSQITDALKVLE